MNRRSFLFGTGTLALSQMLIGCNNSSAATLRVRLLKDSIPGQLLNEFKSTLSLPANLDFSAQEQLINLFNELQNWHQPAADPSKDRGLSLPFLTSKSPIIPDLVTLGDYWLAAAIEQQLIKPLAIEQLPGWQQLPQIYQQLVRRDERGLPSSKGKIWGAPYRWGCTAIAYRRDKLKSLNLTLQDWEDLWHPQLRDRISLLPQPREIIGLTLKSLGHSYNTEQLDKVAGLKDKLKQLHQQAKVYSAENYLQPLLLEDTWVAVGWSSDILSINKTDTRIGAIVPKSGTALWADLWVQPKTASEVEARANLTNEWINFCWQPRAAKLISLLSRATSPLGNLSNEADSLLLADEQAIAKSEFLYPLPAAAASQYQKLWQELT